MQDRVLQDRGVTGGEDEAVAIDPVGTGRVVVHDPRIEHVGERRERHRGALMARAGGMRRIHGEATNRADGTRVEIGHSYSQVAELVGPYPRDRRHGPDDGQP